MKKVGASNPFGVTDNRVKPATEVQIAKLEKRIGARLPRDYRHFLMTINGGRRPGCGWELPKHGLVIDAFYGLRKDFYNLEKEVARVLRREPGTSHYPPDTFSIGYELGNNPIIMKYRGKDSGSVWFWDEVGKGDWRKVGTSFDAFTSMLHQEREPDKGSTLRDVIERDDVEAMRRYVASLPPSKLDEPETSTGHSLVQRAADAGAAKIVAFLIDSGARGIVGLGTVNVKRHIKVIKLLLTRGQYLPTEYDWQSAAAFGGIAAVGLYFEYAPPPPRKVLKTLMQASKNLMKSNPSKERDQVIAILENRLVSPVNKRGSVRNLNVSPRRKS